MVLVGLMLAIAPRVLVPLLGLRRALRDGLLTFALGMVATGLAPTPATFVLGLFVVSIGCVSVAPRRTEALPARRARPHTTRTRAHTPALRMLHPNMRVRARPPPTPMRNQHIQY